MTGPGQEDAKREETRALQVHAHGLTSDVVHRKTTETTCSSFFLCGVKDTYIEKACKFMILR